MRRIGLAILIASLATAGVYAQNLDFNIMGAGARAHGMGGAFIGVADDATAIGWNPAGIAQLEKMEASINGLFNMKKFEFERTGPWPLTEDNSVNHFAPSFGSFIVPLKMGEKNLVFGIAYQRLMDFGYADSDKDPAGAWKEEITQKGGIDAIAPAIALQVTPQFMIGVAGNILVNGTKYNDKTTYTNGDWEETKQDNKYSGFDLNIGTLFSQQKFNIGVAARLPFTISEKIDWDYSQSVGGVTDDTSGIVPESKITFPLMLGVGIAIKPTDKFTLAADYEYRGYSSSEATQSGVTTEMNWLNVNQFRVGLEYIMSGQNAVFPVRLGFRTDPKVFHGWYGDKTDTSQAVGKTFTGGFGLIMGRIMLDLAYEYGWYYYRNWEDAVESVKDKETSHNIMASCIFHF